MPFCIKCGTQLIVDAKFCQSCGQRTEAADPENRGQQTSNPQAGRSSRPGCTTKYQIRNPLQPLSH